MAQYCFKEEQNGSSRRVRPVRDTGFLRQAVTAVFFALGLAVPGVVASEPIGQTNSFIGIALGADFPAAATICEPGTTERCVRPNGANYFEMRNAPDLGFPYRTVVLTERGKATEILLSFSRAHMPAMRSLLTKRFDEPDKTETTPVEFSLEKGVDVSHDALWIGSRLVVWLSEVDPEEEGGAMLQVLQKESFQALRSEQDKKLGTAASKL